MSAGEQPVRCPPDEGGSRLLSAALAYAARGWPVLPCRANKSPYTTHGFKDASADPAVLRDWWQCWPAASIGIATEAAALVVVDVDVKDGAGGKQHWQRLVAELGEQLEETATALTPSGGRHYYYRAGEAAIGCSTSRLAPGIDVRAMGGYVIAPPSVGLGGSAYRWLDGRGLELLCELPQPLAERLLALALEAPRANADPEPAGGAIPKGRRNDALFRAGCAMRRRGHQRTEIEAALRETNKRCEPPLPEEEVERIIESVMGYETENPADLGRPCTDTGNGERLIDTFGERLRYCHELGCWFVFDGSRWLADQTLEIEHLVGQALRGIDQEAATCSDERRRQELRKWATASESAARREAALKLARSERRIVVRAAELDVDPWLLNVANGTLDLRSGTLRAHDSADLISKLAPVRFDPSARHPVWERFLADVTGGDEELAAYLQRAVGYSLTGEMSERVFFLVQGPTTTGKSTFIEALVATLGDYAYVTNFDTFLRQRNTGQARPDVANMAGRRLVVGAEVEAGQHLDEALMKRLVGGDTIAARHFYREDVAFRPQCKPWLASNDSPLMSDTDEALWVRARRLPFVCQIPKAKRDPKVKVLLTDPSRAGAAILAWAVAGCRAWQEQGLGSAESVARSTTTLRAEMDPTREFFSECCRFESGAWSGSTELLGAYRGWTIQNHVEQLSGNELAARLRAHACEKRRRHGRNGWLGVCLQAETGDGGDAG